MIDTVKSVTPLIWKKVVGYSEEELLAMEERVFRTVMQGTVHHSLEIQVLMSTYQNSPLNPACVGLAERFLNLCEKRGISNSVSEYVLAEKYVTYGKMLLNHQKPDFSEFATRRLNERETACFEHAVHSAKPVTVFSDADVPNEAVDELIKAALWAPNGGNLQPNRFLVIREKNLPGLFEGTRIVGSPVHIVVAQDLRCMHALIESRSENRTETYDSPKDLSRNSALNAGAAAQTISLAAYAMGLGSALVTITENIRRNLKNRFSLPDYIYLFTCVDVGYCEGGRISLPEESAEQVTVYHI